VAVSVLMVAAALAVLLIARSSGGGMPEATGFGGRRAAR